MVCRHRRHLQLVHDRLLLVEDVDGVRLVGVQLTDEPLPLPGQRKLPDEESFADGAAVDPVVDADGVAGAQLEEQLVETLHVICKKVQHLKMALMAGFKWKKAFNLRY